MRALIPPFGVENVGSMALNLVFPTELGDDAQRGDMDSVCACGAGGGNVTAETMWYASSYHVSEDDEHWVAVKALLDGVRAAGSYKRYMRTPHRNVLAVRGLAQRGKLSTDDSVLNFLARRADNGVVWHVLSFWRATN